MVERRIPFAVTYCSQYVNKQEPTIHEMEEIAWILRSDARRKTVGFEPARSLKAHERFVLEED
jgi:hypothetical protein